LSIPAVPSNTHVPIRATRKPGFYKDSVTLMRIAQRALADPGVVRATLLMGTDANKAALRHDGLLDGALADAHPSDLMVAIEAYSDQQAEAALAAVESMLAGGEALKEASEGSAAMRPRSLAMYAAHAAHATALAQISVPGPYAGAEALKALRQGLHVFLFSDNVPLAQEQALKRLAERKGLLVMGPDCGTAMLRGVPLGFANAVRRGAIGLVGASGTGLQEVMCRIHELGAGVSHAIGTGSHDVAEEIGGTTMRQGIDLLAADPATRVIAIVSKPPAPAVGNGVLAQLARTGKPAVVLFLGADSRRDAASNSIVQVSTLEDAARAAVASLRGQSVTPVPNASDEQALPEADRLAPSQRYVRGLYSGGTFCTEAQLAWLASGIRARSNAPLDPADTLTDALNVDGHAAIDFGADEFTVGRPHPMIDPATRVAAIARHARDAAVAAIVLDVVLGYGSHPDPAGTLGHAIAEARAPASRGGRHLPVIAFVCGTEEDSQRLSLQRAKLRDAGAIVCASSTAAARLAGALAKAVAERTKPRAPHPDALPARGEREPSPSEAGAGLRRSS
jgi:succinyl-CoA synthetase alpha subunit